MSGKTNQYFERCSFLTQSLLKGWGEDGKPIWGSLVNWDANGTWAWMDWNEAKNRYIAPLCGLASSVTLFGNEWLSDKREVLDLRKFVEEHFVEKERHIVCGKPAELIDASLFWLGGRPQDYSLIPVLSFGREHLMLVLEALHNHNQAGKMSPRSGGAWTSVNNFAKSVVREGGFAVILRGREAEVFFPIECKDQVEKIAKEVEARREAELEGIKRKSGVVVPT